MFGINKPRGNRRLERGFQLDVKLRTDVSDRTRRRGLARWLGRLAVVGVGVAVLTGLVGVARYRWLHHVDALALTHAPVTTDGVLGTSEIIHQAGLRRGLNTMAVDLPTVRQRLLRHSRIATAEVRRELPGTIRHTVRERFPVARVKAVSQPGFDLSYLLDETGHVMLPFQRNKGPAEAIELEAGLPLLVGVGSTTYSVGTALEDRQVLAALRLLSAFDSSTMAGLADIVSVDVSRPQELEVLTVFGSRINFGIRDSDPDFATQLRCWEAVHRDGAGRGLLIGHLDLSVTNNSPLRWLDTTQLPTEPARPRPKRKPVRRHV